MGVAHIQVIRSAIDKLNTGDFDGYLACFDPACLHWLSGSSDSLSMPKFVEGLMGLRQGVPDLHLEPVTLFGVDHYVCAQWRTTGTHTADFFGIAPTWRRVCFDR